MMWSLKQYQIIRRADKLIKDGRDYQFSGIPRSHLSGIFAEEKYYNKRSLFLRKHIFKKDKRNYFQLVEEILESCITDGYLEKRTNGNLVIASKGRKLIDPLQNIWTLLNSQLFLKIFIPSGIVGFILYLIKKLGS